MLFMGGEIGQFIEWRYDEGLEWHLLGIEKHKKLQEYVREINHFYIDNKAFWEIERDWSGFHWINEQDRDNSVISFYRSAKNGEHVVVIANFTPVDREKYVIPVPQAGEYEVIINSDWKRFGGSTMTRSKKYKTRKNKDEQSLPYQISVNLKGLSVVYLKKVRKEEIK